MLPNDILSIIRNYNEPGIFVTLKQDIHWFNGKRLEYWCSSPFTPMITYNGDLYIWDRYVRKYKNKRFDIIQNIFEWNHPLYKFWSTAGPYSICNNLIYQRNSNGFFELFDGDKIIKLPQKNYPYIGLFMLNYVNDIYFFGSDCNEKFSTIDQKWTMIAQTPFQGQYSDVYLFNDKFYNFNYDGTCNCYYPTRDYWHPVKF